MSKFLKSLLFTFTLFLLLTVTLKQAQAVTVDVVSAPSSISNDEFNVGINVNGASNGTNYLRVDIYKEGTSNYFGETFNGSSWYSGSTGTNYAPITIASSSASITVKAKMGNPSSNDYPGSGAYKLRVRRYTSSGSPGSSDQYGVVDLQINYTFATSTPTSTPTTTPTATPLKTNTPTPKPKTPPPTPKPSATPEDEETSEPEQQVLGADSEDASPSPSPLIAGNQQKKFPVIAAAMIGGGVIFLILPVALFFINKKSYNGLAHEKSSDISN